MRKLKYIILKLFSPRKELSKPANTNEMGNKSFYDLKMKSLDGQEVSFSQYRGKKLLIVNTASECGYTPQYAELQQLHEKYGDKITVLGFPSNDFGGQEPGSNAEIGAFCKKNFGVSFRLFEKSDVVGSNQNEVYKWLTTKNENGWNEQAPTWNFCKYLVNEKGELEKFFSAGVSPISTEVLSLL